MNTPPAKNASGNARVGLQIREVDEEQRGSRDQRDKNREHDRDPHETRKENLCLA